jgi:hypothetical protein
MPNPKPDVRTVPLSVEERAAYDKLWDNFRRDIQMAVSGRKSHVSSAALRCIHELRLFCNNGARKPKTDDNAVDQAQADDESFSELETLGKNKCTKCTTPIHSIDRQDEGNGGLFMPSCTQHLICHSCVPQINMRSALCEFCKQDQQAPKLQNERQEAQDSSSNATQSLHQPSKLKALLMDIWEDTSRKW